MVLEILTLIEICAPEMLIHIIDLVPFVLLLLGFVTSLLHFVHKHAFLFVDTADPLHVNLHWIKVDCAALGTSLDHFNIL